MLPSLSCPSAFVYFLSVFWWFVQMHIRKGLGRDKKLSRGERSQNGVVTCHRAWPWARLPIRSIASADVQGNYDRVTQSMTFVEKNLSRYPSSVPHYPLNFRQMTYPFRKQVFCTIKSEQKYLAQSSYVG